MMLLHRIAQRYARAAVAFARQQETDAGQICLAFAVIYALTARGKAR